MLLPAASRFPWQRAGRAVALWGGALVAVTACLPSTGCARRGTRAGGSLEGGAPTKVERSSRPLTDVSLSQARGTIHFGFQVASPRALHACDGRYRVHLLGARAFTGIDIAPVPSFEGQIDYVAAKCPVSGDPYALERLRCFASYGVLLDPVAAVDTRNPQEQSGLFSLSCDEGTASVNFVEMP